MQLSPRTLTAVFSAALLIGASGLPAFAQQQTATARHPNVLFVLTDDQRADALGLGGSKHLKTPHIDALGRQGAYFRNTFCTTSLCSPSRASILSGLYAHTHGVMNNFTEYPTGFRSFPMVLQSAGYDTAYIGKWHMGEDNDEPRPGFNWFVTHKGQGKYFDTEFNVNGTGRKVIPGYYTTVVTAMAEEWLGRDHGGKPWLLMVGHKAPHSFYFPEPKYEHAFDNVPVAYPETAFMLDDKPEWIRQREYTWHGIFGPLFEWRKKFPDDSPAGVRDFAAMTHAYWATILSVDDSVGRLVALLRRRGELDNTIIVFMADNGILNGEDGMVDKRTMHEPSIRIPLVVRYPGLLPTDRPKVIDQQVLTIDMAPSLLELCGAVPRENIHGRSWVKLVRAGDPAWRKSWFYHYNYEQQFPYTPNVRGVRTESWKYVHYPHGDGSADRHMAELYNIEFDPEERHNLIARPKYAPVVAQLQAELARLMAATGLTAETDRMPLDEGIKQQLPDLKIR
ncbi:MAG TPA: sulfatase [Pirellulales bacterium]|jgi:N-acetylglucosamine-6-sulfatase|nr:sulfatase [Pirellulales bacterium]